MALRGSRVHHLPRLLTFWLKAPFLSTDICECVIDVVSSEQQDPLSVTLRRRISCWGVSNHTLDVSHSWSLCTDLKLVVKFSHFLEQRRRKNDAKVFFHADSNSNLHKLPKSLDLKYLTLLLASKRSLPWLREINCYNLHVSWLSVSLAPEPFKCQGF